MKNILKIKRMFMIYILTFIGIIILFLLVPYLRDKENIKNRQKDKRDIIQNDDKNSVITESAVSKIDEKLDSITLKFDELNDVVSQMSANNSLSETIKKKGYTLEQIEALADKAIKNSKNDFELGNANFVKGNYERALEYFQKSLNNVPMNVSTNIYLNIGITKTKILNINFIGSDAYNTTIKGKLEDIINDYSLAIEQNESNFIAYNNRGVVYLELDQLDKAKFDFEKSKHLNPNNPLSYINLSKLYLQKNNPNYIDTALQLLNKAIEIDPLNKIAYYNRANLYELHLNEFDRAIDDYENAIKNGFANKHIYLNMGTTYGRWFEKDFDKEKLNLSQNFYEKSLEIDSSFKDAKQGLLNITILKKRIE